MFENIFIKRSLSGGHTTWYLYVSPGVLYTGHALSITAPYLPEHVIISNMLTYLDHIAYTWTESKCEYWVEKPCREKIIRVHHPLPSKKQETLHRLSNSPMGSPCNYTYPNSMMFCQDVLSMIKIDPLGYNSVVQDMAVYKVIKSNV